MSDKQLSLFTKVITQVSKKFTGEKLTSKRKKGNDAEQQALKYLQAQGLKLLEQNFTTPAGEVDLIMHDGRSSNNESLVFIEVRYRKNADFGGAAASVTPKKQQRIVKAALAYQQKNYPQSSMRFDVVAIEGDNGNSNNDRNDINNENINWIQSAFDGAA